MWYFIKHGKDSKAFASTKAKDFVETLEEIGFIRVSFWRYWIYRLSRIRSDGQYQSWGEVFFRASWFAALLFISLVITCPFDVPMWYAVFRGVVVGVACFVIPDHILGKRRNK